MSIINTQLIGSTVLTADSVIPLGSVAHKSGCNITATANTIRIKGSGFFRVTAVANISATATGTMTLSINDNGAQISSASATVGTANDIVNLTAQAVIYNSCRCNEDIITFAVSAPGTMSEFDVIVEEI